MIISSEQVQRALAYLRDTNNEASEQSVDLPEGITPELVERVKRELADSPEVRGDRIEMARGVAANGVSADEVADKMIGRMISDSIR